MASGDENESFGYAGYMWEIEYSEEHFTGLYTCNTLPACLF